MRGKNTQARAAAIAQQNVLTFPGRPTKADSNVCVTNITSTDANYLLARVRRDAPEVFELHPNSASSQG